MERPVLVTHNQKQMLPLLLLADPEEAMIHRYLEEGDLFVAYRDGEAAAVAVVVPLGDTRCELKNLAVAEHLQGRGYGRDMVEFLCAHYQLRFQTMLVGTSEGVAPFYQKLGFVYSHRVAGFFTEHYAQPIYEQGRQCVDMLYFRRELANGR